jgi:hypothetical protein
LEDLFAAPWIADLGWVDGPELRKAFLSYRQEGREPEKRRIWYAATLELWLRRHRELLGLGDPGRQISRSWPRAASG